MISQDEVAKLKLFLNELLHDSGTDKPLEDHQSLILSRGLDSLAVTRLILFLEENFDFNLESKIHDVSDLDTFAKILQLISSKTNGS